MFPMLSMEVPYLTAAQMREVDRLMIDVYGIALLQMMENAGRNLATLARERFLGGAATGQQVIVLAGSGGNGGGALACARWLHNAGARVQVFLSSAELRLTPVPAHQLSILHALEIAIHAEAVPDASPQPALIIDGLIGYSLNGAPHGIAVQMIEWANANPAPTLALDVPSGLDSTTGTISDASIQADATLTLALPKQVLLQEAARNRVGELYLGNISVPAQLYASKSLGLTVGNLFEHGDIVRIW